MEAGINEAGSRSSSQAYEGAEGQLERQKPEAQTETVTGSQSKAQKCKCLQSLVEVP